MTGKKYIVWPGYVTSRIDSDSHYIDAQRLMFLYGVPPHDCVVAPPQSDQSLQAKITRRQLSVIRGLVHLVPRNDGNYTLPK